MRDRIFIDTNILVYLANEDASLHSDVKSRFEKLTTSNELWISRQVIREYAVIVTREGIIEKPLSSDMLFEDIEKWKLLFQIANETDEVTQNLQNLIRKYSLKGKIIHDANIVATMTTNAIQKIYTLNKNDFIRFEEILIID